MFFKRNKIILINGPTAVGKSSLAIKIAEENNGEIISVDSRQIFKEITEFSGAIKKEEKKSVQHNFVGELSLVENEEFNVSDFSKKVFQKINEILEKNKTPILVGGSSFFFETVIYENFLPEIEPDGELRKELLEKSEEELFQEILEKDKKTAERIDRKNKVRLVRAIEIIRKNGFVPELKKEVRKDFDFREIFIFGERNRINQKIENNFRKRFSGILEEAEILRSKISVEKFFRLGLAYKNIFKFWDGEISEKEFFDLGVKEEQKYAKRQTTYLNKFFDNLPEVENLKKIKIDFSEKELFEKISDFLK